MFLRPRYAALPEKGNRRSTVGVEVVSTTLGDTYMYRVRGRQIHGSRDACQVSNLRFRCKLMQRVPLSGK